MEKPKKIKKQKYPKDMDKECIEFCNLFNTLGLKTKYSCCGHGNEYYSIMFDETVSDLTIGEFIYDISEKKDHTPLVGGFYKWCRKVEDKLVCNWEYIVDNISWAEIDLETIKSVLELK